MYMYQMLSKAIFDSEDKNKIKSDWSPNTIKNIVILRDCIIVVYHTTRQTKFVQLNQAAFDDIMSNGSKGALHNVLGAYQLSCLEEIYVDSVFQNYLGTFNLDKYVNGLKNTRSRLRYCGYVQWVMGAGQNIFNYYNQGKQALSEDYTLAQSKGVVNIGVLSLDNSDWYKKYNLRQDKYKLDKEKGTLDAWFTKVERDMTEYYGQVERTVYANAINNLYCSLFERLMHDINYYRYWYTNLKLLRSGKTNPFGKLLLSAVNNSTETFKPNVYISRETAVKIYNEHLQKTVSKEDFSYALGMLKSIGVLDDEKSGGDYVDELAEKIADSNCLILNFVKYEQALKSYIHTVLGSKTGSLFLRVACENNMVKPEDMRNLEQFMCNRLIDKDHDFNMVIVLLNYACGFSTYYLDETIQGGK